VKRNKTKKLGKVNGNTLIAAIDIGKKVNYGYFRAPDGQDIKPFAFYNLRDGFEKKKVTLVQTNPMHTKRLKELTGNSPNKTDENDPKVIADVIALGHALTLVIPEGPAAELRRLRQARERAIKSRTSMSNQLQHLLFVIFPEFSWTMKHMKSKNVLHLVENCPAPESIVRTGIEPLCAILRKTSRGKLGQERAREIFEAAQKSMGISEGRESILKEIEHLFLNIRDEDCFIASLEREMKHYLEEIPYS